MYRLFPPIRHNVRVLLSIALLIVTSLLASGILFRHQRLLTYLAAAGVLWEGQWLLLTLLNRTLLSSVTPNTLFTVGSSLLLVVSIAFIRKWQSPYRT